MNLNSIEVLVQQDHEYRVSVLLDVYGTEALSRFAIGKQATTLYLKSPICPIPFLNRVISGLPRRCKFDTQNACSFVFGNLAGDTQRLARQGALLLREFLGFLQDVHDPRILRHKRSPNVSLALRCGEAGVGIVPCSTPLELATNNPNLNVSQPFALQKLPYHFLHIPLLTIHFVIELAHFFVGNLSGELA